jgi:Uma2 family endonuclease
MLGAILLILWRNLLRSCALRELEKMTTSAARKPTLYEQLCALPESIRGEIINDQLRTRPRTTGPHALASSRLGSDIEGPYSRGRGGPGGWWIIDEPEIHFIRDREVEVPDIAGWRIEHLPRLPEGHRFEVVPDWVCEVLSPSTKSTDREEKMPVYASFGVAYSWLVDPETHTLEAYALSEGNWLPLGIFRDDDVVRVAPFDSIDIYLADLWI